MAFSRSFPKNIEGVSYPKWIDIYLSENEEELIENKTISNNKKLMLKCIDDAKEIIESKNLKYYQSDIINVAISLFEKLAQHSVHAKERLCKDKFDEQEK